VERSTEKAKLAFLFQFAYPGAPAIYYGDEIGLEGEKDPDSRRAFLWDQSSWNMELYQWVKSLIALRKRYPSLRRGDFQRLLADDTNGHYVFTRALGEEKIVVAMNAAPHQQKVEIPISPLKWANGRVVHNLMDNTRHTISGGNLTLSLPPWSGAWIG
jgi:glycosidase